MFLKISFNHSNTCCEQALKERHIQTQTTTFFTHSLRWNQLVTHGQRRLDPCAALYSNLNTSRNR